MGEHRDRKLGTAALPGVSRRRILLLSRNWRLEEHRSRIGCNNAWFSTP